MLARSGLSGVEEASAGRDQAGGASQGPLPAEQPGKRQRFTSDMLEQLNAIEREVSQVVSETEKREAVVSQHQELLTEAQVGAAACATPAAPPAALLPMQHASLHRLGRLSQRPETPGTAPEDSCQARRQQHPSGLACQPCRPGAHAAPHVPCVQGEVARLERQAVDLSEENQALRAEAERLEARDAALQGYGLDDMHNEQLSQLIMTLTQAVERVRITVQLRRMAATQVDTLVPRATGQACISHLSRPGVGQAAAWPASCVPGQSALPGAPLLAHSLLQCLPAGQGMADLRPARRRRRSSLTRHRRRRTPRSCRAISQGRNLPQHLCAACQTPHLGSQSCRQSCRRRRHRVQSQAPGDSWRR